MFGGSAPHAPAGACGGMRLWLEESMRPLPPLVPRSLRDLSSLGRAAAEVGQTPRRENLGVGQAPQRENWG
ncbi:hypothetical protein GCM10022402_16170 [Salinactinospora qingdaonensis]|uniref:Uncharacterized protein n=1 Tax=Salinactinospora qingdaonensis TaxID=702744 RepID=A0ABP7FIG4_9ACTN